MITINDLSKKTVFELKAYAKKNNIAINEAKTRNEILEIINNFVPEPAQELKEEVKINEKVAVYSLGNLHWQGVGQLITGYNIVSKESSEKWLTLKKVRSATPEELANYYGK